jgi:hypothetical protein
MRSASEARPANGGRDPWIRFCRTSPLKVIDTSALIAILSDEPEAPGLEAAIEADSVRLLSAASLVEASIVIERRYGEAGGREVD